MKKQSYYSRTSVVRQQRALIWALVIVIVAMVALVCHWGNALEEIQDALTQLVAENMAAGRMW